MPVIGITFKTMQANRLKDNVKGEIKINSTPAILDVTEINVPALNKKALSLSFEFKTSYDPGVGEVKIGGRVLYTTNNNLSVIKKWKKDKKLPEDLNVDVLNNIFRRCLIRVANLADDLQLPPPIPMPKVRPASNENSYIG